MRRTLIALTLILSMGLAGLATTASAADTAYSFRLTGPNTALATTTDEHHEAGDYIRVTGSGTFDPSTGGVAAGGSFTHFKEDGTVHMRGTWEALSFVSFSSTGGPKPSRQGGTLVLTVAHFDENGDPCACDDHGGGVMATFTSSINLSLGDEAGTTMGHFGEPAGGDVLFSIEE